MSPRNQAIASLEENGYHFSRHGANHDIYTNSKLKCSIPLKRHDFNENDLRYIQKEIKHNRDGRG